MSGFAGFFDAEESLTDEKYLWMALARRMAQRLSHRGPDGRGAHVSSRCAVAHVQRSVPGAEYGAQPMTCTENGRTATIVWDGELC
ncbi:MAG: asparagine synthetase B, partial [Acutalibacteraceae bacterium]